MADQQLILVADIHGRGGLRDELKAVLEELAGASRDEAGCAAFRVFAAEDPGDFVMLATWSDEQALRDHYGTDHYRRYRDQVGPLLARPSDVIVHRVSTSVHALDPNPPDPGKLG